MQRPRILLSSCSLSVQSDRTTTVGRRPRRRRRSADEASAGRKHRFRKPMRLSLFDLPPRHHAFGQSPVPISRSLSLAADRGHDHDVDELRPSPTSRPCGGRSPLLVPWTPNSLFCRVKGKYHFEIDFVYFYRLGGIAVAQAGIMGRMGRFDSDSY